LEVDQMEVISPWLTRYRDWFQENVLTCRWPEQRVVSSEFGYAGNAPYSIAGDTVVITITNHTGITLPPDYWITVTDSFGVSTFSQIGPDSDNTYSGSYNYIRRGCEPHGPFSRGEEGAAY